MATASAPGKVILFGEHAVVYGQPAIAVPLQDIRADATITPLDAQPGMIYISAPDIEHEFWLHEADEADALAQTVRLSLSALGIDPHQSFAVHVTSSIPVASGMGSGAAVSVAVIRAMLAHFKLDFRDADISAIAYEVEKIHHGTPSGIDNTVVCYEQTVYFQKGSEPIFLELDHPFSLVIANTGVLSSTARAVGNVRSSWSHARVKFDDFFERIGEITKQARTCLRSGDTVQLGRLMQANQLILEEIGISSPELRTLIGAAEGAGALGAKLSGAGMGGIIIALPGPGEEERLMTALRGAGAIKVFKSRIAP